MTTPTSQLGMSHIQTEFGGTNPIALSEYYGVTANVPSSGTIRMASFLGISSGPPVVLSSVDIIAADIAGAQARATWYANGTFIGAVFQDDNGDFNTSVYTWLKSGSAGDYQIRATRKAPFAGVVPVFSSGWANNTFAAMSSDRFVYVFQTVNGLSYSTFNVTIRYTSNSVTIVSTDIYLEALEK